MLPVVCIRRLVAMLFEPFVHTCLCSTWFCWCESESNKVYRGGSRIRCWGGGGGVGSGPALFDILKWYILTLFDTTIF